MAAEERPRKAYCDPVDEGADGGRLPFPLSGDGRGGMGGVTPFMGGGGAIGVAVGVVMPGMVGGGAIVGLDTLSPHKSIPGGNPAPPLSREACVSAWS